MNILLVEDDEMLGNGLREILEMNNYEVTRVTSCRDALSAIRQTSFHLFILDIRLPDGNGIDLCKNIRSCTLAPIIFLSGYEDESYIVGGLKAGGDDYIIKPFRTMELLARIEAQTRRQNRQAELIGYSSDVLYLDLSSMRVFCNQEEILLSPIEYRVLLKLVTGKGQVFTPDVLIESTWAASGTDSDESMVRVWIARLRKHLSEHGIRDAIETRRGVGYRWRWQVNPVYR